MSPKSPDRETSQQTAALALKRALRNVRTEQALAVKDLAPDPVHDLRVALRRCRSLAEGFLELNLHPQWRHLRKASKDLLDGLNVLRDNQVMHEWVHRFGFDKGPIGTALEKSLDRDHRDARRAARRALKDFSRKRWKRWARRLPKRAARITASEGDFARLALERLKEARRRELRWRTSRTPLAEHHLRITLKRFRYTVESFLPEQAAAWSADLKRLQDQLGNMHDLYVLRRRVLPMLRERSVPEKLREQWLGKIERARNLAEREYWKAIRLKSTARRTAAQSRTLWDRWETKLTHLGGVTSPVAEEPLPSAAKPASRAARKSSRRPGRPRLLSAAQ